MNARVGGNNADAGAVVIGATEWSRTCLWEVPMRMLLLLGLLAIAVPLTIIVADASQSSGHGAGKFGCDDCQ
jgi:hypothetical protein